MFENGFFETLEPGTYKSLAMIHQYLFDEIYDFAGKAEEKISKQKAVEMFENGFFETLEPGTYKSLAMIHQYLFDEIYDFAGKLRKVNISKGNFRFAPLMYLEAALQSIDKMPQSTFDEIVEKYY